MGKVKSIGIQLCGELALRAGEQIVDLPQSRKTRALLAYLAWQSEPVRRTELCELLWESSDDPRASLRWSLSRLRSLALSAGADWLRVENDTLALNREEVSVDAERIRKVLESKRTGNLDELLELERRFGAEMLQSLAGAGGAVFGLWLESVRVTLQKLHGQLVDRILASEGVSDEQRLLLSARCIALNPFDDRANINYLRELVTTQGSRAGREALNTMLASYRREKQPELSLVSAWRELTKDGLAEGSAWTAAGSVEESSQPELPDKPSLAVLDFDVIGSHPEGEVLARGLTVDLNSRLARLPNFFVIARASSASFRGREFPPQEVARQLGVRYLIFGSTQRSDTRARVTVTLIDAINDSEVWSEHYDRQLDDLFDVQDDITGTVVAAIEPAIEQAEAERSLLKPPENLNAWEYFHRGLWHCFHFVPGENETASNLFARAVELDPNFSRAYAGLSFTHFTRAFLNSTDDVDKEVQLALEAGRASVGLDSRDSMAHWSLGRALFLARQHDQALASVDQALRINPNYAQGHYARGFIGIHAGQDQDCLPFLDSAQRLSPFDPLLFAMKSSRGMSLANQGLFDEAVAWAVRATHEPNAHFHIYAIAAACLQLAERSRDARDNAAWVLKRRPDFSVEFFKRSFPHKNETQREPFIQALLQAGIPRGA